MNSALSPREIQARLRAGASVPEVAAEAGVEVDRIEGFALPVMAERAHMTRTALGASVRRRGDGSGHRRLGEIVRERLQARSLDADTVEWDSWRQNDLKWRLVGLLDDQAASRAAEFIFDPKGRFSVADNADARWMIGESLPGPQTDPDNENTIDFNDELALVRAISNRLSGTGASGRPGDDVPPHDSQYEGAANTSELDELYDMLSGVSDDSVRIYLGLEDTVEVEDSRSSLDEESESLDQDDLVSTSTPDDSSSAGSPQESSPDVPPEGGPQDTSADKLSEHSQPEGSPSAEPEGHDGVLQDAAEPLSPAPSAADGLHAEAADEAATSDATTTDTQAAPDVESGGTGKSDVGASAGVSPYQSPPAPEQDPLVPDAASTAPKRKPAKKRASIPSWDEIMFGGPSRG